MTVSVHMVDHFGTAVQDYIGLHVQKTSVHGMDDFGTFSGPFRYINFGTLLDRYKSFVCDVLHIFKSTHAVLGSAVSSPSVV